MFRVKLMVQGLVCKFFWNRKGLVIIFKNILGLLEKCRGLFIIKFKWWRVCLQKGETGRAFLEKGKGSLANRFEGRGFWA